MCTKGVQGERSSLDIRSTDFSNRSCQRTLPDNICYFLFIFAWEDPTSVDFSGSDRISLLGVAKSGMFRNGRTVYLEERRRKIALDKGELE